MKRCLSLLIIAILLSVSVSSHAGSGSVYRLAFRALHLLPGERMSKFELHVVSAMIVGFRSIPVGWRIDIDNDPSWMTQVSGIAVVGAADLDVAALQPWFLLLLTAPGAHSEQEQQITVAGSLTLSRGDSSRIVGITNRDLVLMPSAVTGIAR